MWVHALLTSRFDCCDGFSQNEQGYKDPFEAMERKLSYVRVASMYVN